VGSEVLHAVGRTCTPKFFYCRAKLSGGREESSVFIRVESLDPSRDAAGGCALPSAWLHTAASVRSTQPASARACSRTTENPDD